MRSKALWQVCIETSPEAEEAVAELLARVFTRPVAAYTNAETKATLVSLYCERRGEWTKERRGDLEAGLVLIRLCGLKLGAGIVSVKKVTKENWAESWKRHFKAIEISGRLLVRPGWIKRRPRPGQALVVLNPGLSFGTGNHPTTAFCLRALAQFRKPGASQSFLDIGTGSGILAIAAAKLGYRPVLAMDFDAEAVRVARINAKANQVKIEIIREDVTKLSIRSGEKYDFVCANLISDLLVKEMKRITARLRPGGGLALAGILQAEFAVIESICARHGLRLIKARTEGEWRSGFFRLRAGTDADAK